MTTHSAPPSASRRRGTRRARRPGRRGARSRRRSRSPRSRRRWPGRGPRAGCVARRRGRATRGVARARRATARGRCTSSRGGAPRRAAARGRSRPRAAAPRGARLLDVVAAAAARSRGGPAPRRGSGRPPSRGRGRAARRPPAARAAGPCRSSRSVEVAVRARSVTGRREVASGAGTSAPAAQREAQRPAADAGRSTALTEARSLLRPPPYTAARAAPLALRRRSRVQRGPWILGAAEPLARPARGAGPDHGS